MAIENCNYHASTRVAFILQSWLLMATAVATMQNKVTNKKKPELTSLPEVQWCENPLWFNMLCSRNVISI